MPRFVATTWLMACLLLIAAAGPVRADDPLPVRIDRLIAARFGNAMPAPRSDDAEFVRRIHLDLAGRIPTLAETRAFLADPASDKRETLIDRLLASPDHPRRMQEAFHATLVERRGDNAAWAKFLRHAFETNRPWDDFVRAVLAPDPAQEHDQGAAYFLTVRLVSEGAMAAVDVPALTRDVGRMFAGLDLQCAQCHDHLTVDDYKQRDFQGLHVVFENVKAAPKGDVPAVTEGILAAKKEFASVFTQEKMLTGPVVPGAGEIPIPVLPKGEEYLVPPDRKAGTNGTLRFSPLKETAARLASRENAFFRRNAVNRLWFLMMGRGLVEPLDLQHAKNPPSHPELLDLLAAEFAAGGFDVRRLLRDLARTETYQRSSVMPEGVAVPPPASFAVALEKRLSAEQLYWSTLVATGEYERILAAVPGGAPDPSAPRPPIDVLADKDETAKGLRKLFVDAFANAPTEPETDFEPSVKGALFVLNDPKLLALFAPREAGPIARMARLPDEAAVSEELYLTLFSRPPTESERAVVARHLAKHPDRRAEAIGRIAWALAASTEFVANH